MSAAILADQEVDRLYAAWRAAVETSIAAPSRAACKEAIRLFALYRVAKERAAHPTGGT